MGQALALACRLNPSALSSLATVGDDTRCPAAASSVEADAATSSSTAAAIPDHRGTPVPPMPTRPHPNPGQSASPACDHHRVCACHRGAQHPDRDAQFRYLNDRARDHIGSGDPVISVDTKKKELVGQFKKRWAGMASARRALRPPSAGWSG